MSTKIINDDYNYYGEWEYIDESVIIFTHKNIIHRNLIAAFDFDDTLVTTKSKSKFPTASDDWSLLYKHIPRDLKILFNSSFKIVLFTNQKGAKNGKGDIDIIIRRLEDFMKYMDSNGIPLQIFISLCEDYNRKPNIGMWNLLMNKYNDLLEIDKIKSYFVGDACGRPAKWKIGKKKDHSASDYKLALNIGINFFTPEEYFLDEEIYPRDNCELGFKPNMIFSTPLGTKSRNKSLYDYFKQRCSKKQEMIILVGYPGSGKSSIVKEYCSKYIHINRDKLKTQAKCLSLTKNLLQEGNSVIIDNTNPDSITRSEYIKLAQQFKIPIVCVWLNVDIDICKHMNRIRSYDSKGEISIIPDIVYNIFKGKFKEPSEDEGFDDIFKLEFVPYNFITPTNDIITKYSQFTY